MRKPLWGCEPRRAWRRLRTLRRWSHNEEDLEPLFAWGARAAVRMVQEHGSDHASQLGLTPSSQRHSELTAARRREPRQVSAIQVSCAACCSTPQPRQPDRQRCGRSGRSPSGSTAAAPLRMPLRRRRKVIQVAAPRRRVAPQLPRDRRRRSLARGGADLAHPVPCTRHRAISSRSAKLRYRPESGFDERDKWDGGIPPA
jgi:hypothetical protein